MLGRIMGEPLLLRHTRIKVCQLNCEALWAGLRFEQLSSQKPGASQGNVALMSRAQAGTAFKYVGKQTDPRRRRSCTLSGGGPLFLPFLRPSKESRYG